MFQEWFGVDCASCEGRCRPTSAQYTTKALEYILTNFISKARRLTDHPKYHCHALRTLALTPLRFSAAF